MLKKLRKVVKRLRLMMIHQNPYSDRHCEYDCEHEGNNKNERLMERISRMITNEKKERKWNNRKF